jgi:outer membrane protein TolC
MFKTRKLQASFRMLIIALGSLSPVLSVQAAPNLAETIQAAVDRNPRVNLPAARMQLGQGYEKQAGSWLGNSPSASLLYKSDEIGSQLGYREMEAALALPMWHPGQRKALQAVSENIRAQAGSDERLLYWEVSSQVFEYAWMLKLAEQESAQAKTQWESAQALEDDIHKRMKAGELPRTDALMAEQESASRHSKYEQALLAEAKARSAWKSYTGLDELPADLLALKAHDPVSVDQHPTLKNSELAVQTARSMSQSEQKKSKGNPLVTLYAKRDRGTETDPWDNSMGVQLSLPFSTGTHSAGQIAEAEMKVTEAEVQKAEVQRKLALLQEQSRQELDSTKTTLALAEDQNRIAQSRLGLTQRAFELGETGLFLLLQARNEAAQAASYLERSRVAYHQAISRYNLSLGVIPE